MPVGEDAASLETQKDALFQQMLRDPANLDVTFKYADVAARLGDYEAAVAALERMLLFNPDLPRVQLELGVLYFRMGSYGLAPDYFDRAAAANPPPEIRDRLDQYMGEIEKGESRHRLTGYFFSGVQYQTNANVAGSSVILSPIGPILLNNQFTKQASGSIFGSGSAGGSRTTQTLTGCFGGIMNTTVQTTPYVITGATSLSTDAATNRVAATLTSDPTANGDTIKMQFGGLTASTRAREAFIDDNIYGAAESVTQPQQLNGQDLVVGPYPGGPDPNVSTGNTAQAGKLYLLSSGAAPPPNSLLPSGASYCQCQYLQWGYWGGHLRVGNSTNDNISRVDRGGINFWAAGQITSIADMNTLASQGAIGSYNGHLIGSVFNNGAQYVAAGGLAATYNFATRAGSFAVNNYDGRSFTFSGSPMTSPGGQSYQFSINNPQGLPITGAVNGSFYGPMAAETGGNFTFKTNVGPTYLTSGIFAAKR